MKAKLITQVICKDMFSLVHGQTFPIKRLVVPEANNLVISIYDGTVLAETNFDLEQTEHDDGILPPTGKIETLGEVEITDELVQKTLNFVRAQNEFVGLKSQFEALLA